MINEDDLLEGNSYFLVGFFDNNLSIPDIETYIYVGKNVLPSDNDSEEESWYFQDPETYSKKGPFFEVQGKVDIDILRVDQDTLELVYNLDGVIEVLIEIKGHKKSKGSELIKIDKPPASLG